MARNHTKDMTKGSPTKLLLMFTLPMLLGNLFQQFYNMADTVIVGQYADANALGAVGATGSISFFIFALTFGMASGIGVVVSQLFGAGQVDELKKAVSTAMFIMAICAIITGTIGIVAARPIMTLLGTPALMIDDSVLYLQVTCAGLLSVAIYNGVSSILRALGDSKTPLIFLSIACAINVLLDLLFVIEFKMDVLGVAVATVIAQTVAGAGCFIYAVKKVPVFKIPLNEWKIDRHILRRCITLGVPVAVQNAMISISCIVLQSVVNSFGETIVSAFTAVSRFEQLVHQPFTSLGAAIATFTGQNIGAGNVDRVKKGFWSGTMISIIFSLLMIPVGWLGGDAIMRMFTDDPQVILEGARGIRITCLFYGPLGMIYVTRNLLIAVGDVKFAFASGLVEVGGRVGFSKPLTYIPAIGMLSIWYTTGLTWLITAIISCIRYAGGKWQQDVVIRKEDVESE